MLRSASLIGTEARTNYADSSCDVEDSRHGTWLPRGPVSHSQVVVTGRARCFAGSF